MFSVLAPGKVTRGVELTTGGLIANCGTVALSSFELVDVGRSLAELPGGVASYKSSNGMFDDGSRSN
jgi:hypothetical protein